MSGIVDNINAGSIVVFESTVYPGITEEIWRYSYDSFGSIHFKICDSSVQKSF